VGQSLSLSVVAEGIEEHEQRTTLEQMGCEMAQGFLLGHPGPARDIEVLLAHDGQVSAASAPTH
jgi:EAL domain-containing protein (putative c-di-GMP-specific phosphodiesterase class I)